MKLAFVGKGGSGKSTLSALFVRYLQSRNKGETLVIDADINMNLAGLLGVELEKESFLSHPDVACKIRNYLRGSNARIKDENNFLPTTPPGNGSNLILSACDPVLRPLCQEVSRSPRINLLTVGTYDSKGIGETCYHSHLFVAENLLSHTISNDEFHVVCDMVAGTDAFAYSMHLQFDGIFLIAEPSPESVEVCRLYLELAEESGVSSLVHVIANKIEDEDDLSYIRRSINKEPLYSLPKLNALKKARQLGKPISEIILDTTMHESMEAIERAAAQPGISNMERLSLLKKLHLKLNEKQWVKSAYGDVAHQIDPDFDYRAKELMVAAK